MEAPFRVLNLLFRRSRRLRAFVFELPASRFRMAMVSRGFAQIVADMNSFRFDRLRPQISPDALAHWFDLGSYCGPEGWENGLRDWLDGWDDPALEMREFIDPGNGQVLCAGTLRGRGPASGVMVAQDLCFLIRVEDGMAAGGRFLADKREALAALGLSE